MSALTSKRGSAPTVVVRYTDDPTDAPVHNRPLLTIRAPTEHLSAGDEVCVDHFRVQHVGRQLPNIRSASLSVLDDDVVPPTPLTASCFDTPASSNWFHDYLFREFTTPNSMCPTGQVVCPRPTTGGVQWNGSCGAIAPTNILISYVSEILHGAATEAGGTTDFLTGFNKKSRSIVDYYDEDYWTPSIAGSVPNELDDWQSFGLTSATASKLVGVGGYTEMWGHRRGLGDWRNGNVHTLDEDAANWPRS